MSVIIYTTSMASSILDVALTCAVESHIAKSGSRQSGGRLGGALHPHVAQCRDNFFLDETI